LFVKVFISWWKKYVYVYEEIAVLVYAPTSGIGVPLKVAVTR
jgi:hypothetical protein